MSREWARLGAILAILVLAYLSDDIRGHYGESRCILRSRRIQNSPLRDILSLDVSGFNAASMLKILMISRDHDSGGVTGIAAATSMAERKQQASRVLPRPPPLQPDETASKEQIGVDLAKTSNVRARRYWRRG